jgi:translation initiation factor 4E
MSVVEQAITPSVGSTDTPSEPNFSTLHPLNGKWCLFYNGPSKDKSLNWEDTVKKVMTLGTVEDFWG